MENSLIFFILMLLGFANGLIVSLLILVRKKTTIFIKLIAVAVILLDFTILREFLFVFGNKIQLKIHIENLLHFKLWVIAIIITAYDYRDLYEPKFKKHLLIPGAIEFLILGIIAFGILKIPKIISDSLFILTDFIAFFWILFEFNRKKKESTEKGLDMKFLFFFVLVFTLIALTRILQFIAVLVDSNLLYRFHFLFRITSIGIIIYTISIFLIGVFVNQVRRKSTSRYSIQPKNEELLRQIKNEQKYLERNITLGKLASYYEVDSTTLSATIRKHEDTSFNNYLNSLRLEYFMSLIEDSEHKKFTIIALAEKSGFNSKATFNRVFKKEFGKTPSEYISKHI